MAPYEVDLLRRRHPKIVDIVAVDSRTGTGIAELRTKLGEKLFHLLLMLYNN